MTITILHRRHGIGPDPYLHAVRPNAPIVDVPGVGEVRFSLCNLATELGPPVGRSWLRCKACHRRELELHAAADNEDST